MISKVAREFINLNNFFKKLYLSTLLLKTIISLF